MGGGCSTAARGRRRAAAAWALGEFGRIPRRKGHPTSKPDGYDFGLRVKVRGTKASWFVATSRETGEKVSIKEIYLTDYSQSDAIEEAVMLSRLQHSFIPRLRSLYLADTSVCMIFEFIDPLRLKNYVDIKARTTTLSVADVRNIARDMLTGVIFCHNHRYVLRSLTADNILMKKSGLDPAGNTLYDVKLIDLAMAVPEGSTTAIADHPLFEWSDVYYIAPEALIGAHYSYVMDVWSIGVLLYLMLSGTLPFYSEDDRSLVESIKHASYSFDTNASAWQEVNDSIKYLIGSILMPDPTQRPSALDIQRDQWIVSG